MTKLHVMLIIRWQWPWSAWRGVSSSTQVNARLTHTGTRTQRVHSRWESESYTADDKARSLNKDHSERSPIQGHTWPFSLTPSFPSEITPTTTINTSLHNTGERFLHVTALHTGSTVKMVLLIYTGPTKVSQNGHKISHRDKKYYSWH